MNQHTAKTALQIQEGACNPRAIARALVDSLDSDAGGPASAASRLILHQLVWVMLRTDDYERLTKGFSYHEDTKTCELVAKAVRS